MGTTEQISNNFFFLGKKEQDATIPVSEFIMENNLISFQFFFFKFVPYLGSKRGRNLVHVPVSQNEIPFE